MNHLLCRLRPVFRHQNSLVPGLSALRCGRGFATFDLTGPHKTSFVEHVVKDDNTVTSPVTTRFAVVLVGGLQYKVTVDDVIVVNNLDDAVVGSDYALDNVLLVGSKDYTVVGRPLVKGAKVTAFVEEKTHDEKILIFKKRRKNNGSKRMRGFRRQVDLLRITNIDYSVPN